MTASSRSVSTRIVLALLTLSLLPACAFRSTLPKVKVGDHKLPAGQPVVLKDQILSRLLLEAEATPVRSASTATERFLTALQARIHLHDWNRPMRITNASGDWELSFDNRPMNLQGKSEEWSPHFFDTLIPASDFKLKNYKQIVSGSGAGVPLVLTYEDVESLKKERAFRPGNALYVPATAVLDFGARGTGRGGATPVRVRFFDTTARRTALIDGKNQPLAYNTTAVVEATLGNTYIVKNGLLGLFRPANRMEDIGVFGLTAYDAKKIPIVFVHGLNSSPAIWRNAVNEIHADKELNSRYQPLLFIYPTGLSVPGAAAKLREKLNLYRRTWDPDRNDPNFDRMIIVGHSMGGLLTRLQVIDSGEKMRQAFFVRPIEENLWLTNAQKQSIRETLYFKPQPFVKRVVFIAVPHRGSQIADFDLVRLVVRLIRLPLDVTEIVTNAVQGNIDSLNPGLRRYHGLGLRSVEMLSPEHPYFEAMEECEIVVPCHSIIGDRGRNNGAKGSDGVVPYSSAHLDFAASEKIVPHPHGCTQYIETLDELERIYRLHAKN